MNINVINQEKWYSEIKYLAKKVTWNTFLTKDEKQNAISDALLAFLMKVETGTIMIDHYDQYKGYMFMCIRSHVNRQYQIRNYHKNKMYYNHADVIEMGAPMVIPMVEHLDLSKLSPRDRAIFRWANRGWSQLYLGKVLNMDKSHIWRILARIRQELNEAL